MKAKQQTTPQSPFIIQDSKPTDWVDAQVILQSFPFSKRDLQTMRTKNIIPYAQPLGKILYHLPTFLKVLEADAHRQSVTKRSK